MNEKSGSLMLSELLCEIRLSSYWFCLLKLREIGKELFERHSEEAIKSWRSKWLKEFERCSP